MLYRMDKLIGMSIAASDGEIGKVSDVYFDDHFWAARYLVVKTGGYFDDRQVLISPRVVTGIDWDQRILHVGLTRQKVKASPPFDTDKPVARQHEAELAGYYGYPGHWSGPLLWGESLYPVTQAGEVPHVNEALPGCDERPADRHLRSAKEVTGYHLQASGDAVGHLEDFLVESDSWLIRYIVVDTRNWWPGKHVVISPQWIKGLDWDNKLVNVDVTPNTVKLAPKYEPNHEYSREIEVLLYEHYERPGYW
jgi:sporulation protein YlmC with PRC-barrel domain